MFTSLVMKKAKQSKIGHILALFAALAISGCVGSGSDPVIYVAPESDASYTTANFYAEVEFPDGLPPRTEVEIRINGVDVTADFDVWGTTTAYIMNPVDSVGAYPLMMGAFRDGKNTFQVTKPLKKIIYFDMNLAGSEVHVTEVIDGYCGTVFIDGVGDTTDLADGVITDFDCSDYYWKKCVHASNIDYSKGCDSNGTCGYDNLGNPIYASILGAECKALSGGPAVPAYSLAKGSTKGMYIRGYFEGGEPMTSMVHKSYTISTDGTWTQATSRTINYGTRVDWTGGDGNAYYAEFGTTGAVCNGVTVDLKLNEFCMMVPDRDGVSIMGTDGGGTGYTEWVRSDIPLIDSRIGSGGVYGLRAEATAMEVVLDTIGKEVTTTGNLAQTPIDVISPADPPPDFCLGCSWMQVTLDDLRIKKMDMASDFPAAPSGRLNMAIDLNCATGGCTGRAIAGSGDIDYDCNQYEICIWGAGCTYFDVIECVAFGAAGIAGPWDFEANASTDAEVLIFLDPNYEMHTTTALPNFYLGDLVVNLDTWLDGFVDILIDVLVPIMQDFIGDMVSDAIETLVDTVFNKDLPLLRIVIQSVNTDGEFYQIYMALRPEIATFTTSENSHDEYDFPIREVAGELAIGLHATGKPRINQAIGSRFDSSAPGLFAPTTAKNNDSFNDRNVGMTLNETFVNQLFMGLWESGILYVDFNAGNNPTVNTFMDNARITFASKSPWVIGHFAEGEGAKGDVVIDVNDLVIGFSGDVYNSAKGEWEYDVNVFEMILEFQIYADLVADAGAIRIDLDSNPTFELLSMTSDYFQIDTATANSLIQSALPYLLNTETSLRVEVPVIANMHFEIGDVWVPDTGNLALTLDAWCDAPECEKVNNDERTVNPTGDTNFIIGLQNIATNTYMRSEDGGPLYSDVSYYGLESVYQINSNPAVDGCIRNGDTVWLKNNTYGLFVTSNGDGSLTADSTNVSGDQFFTIIEADGLTGCIGDGSNIYLVAKNTGNVIRVNGDGSTSQEGFASADADNRLLLSEGLTPQTFPISVGNINFMSRETLAFARATNNGGAGVEADQFRLYTGNEASYWEVFSIKMKDGIKPGSTCITDGAKVQIKKNTWSWIARPDGTLTANTTNEGTWETFVLENWTQGGCLQDKDYISLYNETHGRYISTNPALDNTSLNADFNGTTNVAVGKTATQSSSPYAGPAGLASQAVDGNTDGNWANNSVTHTSSEAGAWWMVDLGGNFDLNRVTLWNRTDCCSNRLTNFNVEYLNSSGTVIASSTYGGTAGVTTNINLLGNDVRSVRIQLNGTGVLSLAEVQVWAKTIAPGAGEQFMVRINAPMPNSGGTSYNSGGVGSAARTVNLKSVRDGNTYMQADGGGGSYQVEERDSLLGCGWGGLSACWSWHTYYYDMKANTTNTGGWETFRLHAYDSQSNNCLMDRDRISIQVQNGQWAQKWNGTDGYITVRNTGLGRTANDKRFVLVNQTNPAGCLRAGDKISLLDLHTRFMFDNGEWVYSSKTWAGSWESWIVEGTVLSP